MSGAAVITVQEQTARFGNLQVTKETALMATEQGIVAIERQRIEEHQPVRALPPPAPVYIQVTPERSWYDPRDKDCGIAFLLVLMWIVFFAIALPLAVLYYLCIVCFCNDD